jgi:hypothetical protein
VFRHTPSPSQQAGAMLRGQPDGTFIICRSITSPNQ